MHTDTFSRSGEGGDVCCGETALCLPMRVSLRSPKEGAAAGRETGVR